MLRRLFLLSTVASIAFAVPTLAAVDPAELRAQVVSELAPLQFALRSKHSDSFGGLWIDASGRPTIALAASDPAAVDLISQSALSVAPIVVSALYSEAELEYIHATINKAASDQLSLGDTNVAAIETDIVNNRVNVVAVDASAAQLHEIEARFGPGVKASSTSALATGNACTKSNCPNPLKGGLRLYQHSTFWCMSGFVMFYSSAYWLSTAGHCSTIGDTYQHPSGSNIGNVSGQGWVNNSAADASIIRISASQASNYYLIDNTGYMLRVTSVENPAAGEEVVGEDACVARQTTNQCGTLKSVNNTVYICEGSTCRRILWLRRASVTTVGGDSGAPVTVAGKAMGIISASYPGVPTDSLYSHEKNIEAYFLLQTKTTP
jgi:hypothetical protein